MRIGYTDHAVDRYIQFYAEPERRRLIQAKELGDDAVEVPPEPSRAEIRALLETHAPNAVKLKDKSVRGDTMWRIEALGCVLITKPDNGQHVCVTILAPFVWDARRGELGGMTEHERELIEERLADVTAKEEAARQKVVDHKAETHRIAVAPKNTMPAGRKEEVLANRTAMKEVLIKEQQLLAQERAILADILKTIRTKLSQDRNLFDAKEALRIAVGALLVVDTLGSTPEVKAALKRIESIQDGFLKPEFYNLQVDMHRRSA